MGKIFYVYEDAKPDGEVFYVGKGTEARIRQVKRNRWHQFICEKFPDWTRTRVFEGTEKDCFAKECELIAFYGRRDKGLGSLVNLTDGGEGICGAVLSDDFRKKNSARLKGNQYASGIKHTEAAKNAKRKRQKGLKHSEAALAKMREYAVSFEGKAKKSAATKGKKQTPEQIAKRVAAVAVTKQRKKNESV